MMILKYTWNFRGLRVDTTIMKKKSKLKGLRSSDIKNYYEATRTKMVWNWLKDRQIVQQIRIQSKGRDLQIHNPFRCDKSDIMLQRKESVVVCHLDILSGKKEKKEQIFVSTSHLTQKNQSHIDSGFKFENIATNI